MHRVETVGAAHEIGRALGRAADSTQLGHALRLHAHFVHGIDDALGDRVVAAAGTERRLAATVVDYCEADAVRFWGRRAGGCARHIICPPLSSVRRLRSGRPSANREYAPCSAAA